MTKAIKERKVYSVHEHGEIILTGTYDEVLETLGKSRNWIHKNMGKPKDGIEVKVHGTLRQVYALYHGDTFLGEGSINQIAEMTGMKVETVGWLRFNAAKTRKSVKYSLIILEGETVIERKTLSRYAEKRTEVEEEPKAIIKINKRPVKQAEWKPSEHSRMLFNFCFKGWGVKA